jgi:hypothetical protein
MNDHLRNFLLILFAVFLLTVNVFSATTAPTPLDRMKTLVGEWEAKGHEGEPTHARYELISGGSAVMESLDMPDGMNMVSIYHMNNGKLMMTHYCAENNQPRMEATTSGDPNQLTFNFVDATNLSTPSASHMHKVVITFRDKDHFSQEWTHMANGKDSPFVFEYTRVK